MDQTKIDNHQMFSLVANFTMGTTILTFVSTVAGFASRDAWISALIAPVAGLPFLWMYDRLGKLYPDKTLVEIICSVFGKWVGWIISAFFVLFVCLMDVPQVMYYIGNFMKTEYMTETPLYAMNTLLAVALAIGLLYGLEAIARSSEFFVYISSSLILFMIILVLQYAKTDNLLPVFEDGIVPVLKGTLQLTAYLTWPMIVFNMIFPLHVSHPEHTKKSALLGYLWGALFNFLCTITSLLVLGSTITAKSLYPTYLLAKEIDISGITRIEGVVSLSWILAEFIKVCLYFYAGVTGLCQLFGIKDHKKIVLPLTLVVLVFSGVVYPDAAYQQKWDSTTWVPFIGTFGALLPAILIGITKLKRIWNNWESVPPPEG